MPDKHRRTGWAGGDALAARFRACCLRKGWDVGELARHAGVSRTTLYHLERGITRRPRLSTLSRIAAVLEIAPEELWCEENGAEQSGASGWRFRPPGESAPRTWSAVVSDSEDVDEQRRFDRLSNTTVTAMAHQSPELFVGWTSDEWDELYSTFGTGGPLTPEGVADVAAKMNRRRETVRQLNVVFETHLRDVAAGLVETLYKMIRPDFRALDRRALKAKAFLVMLLLQE